MSLASDNHPRVTRNVYALSAALYVGLSLIPAAASIIAGRRASLLITSAVLILGGGIAAGVLGILLSYLTAALTGLIVLVTVSVTSARANKLRRT